MRFHKLRITWSALFGAVVFSIIHLVAGSAICGAWVVLGHVARPMELVKILTGTLADIWWFPAHEIYTALHIRNTFLSIAAPISNSLLCGAVGFAIWRANH